MKQKISGFHQDKQGDWVAELACGHTRHFRHQPPFQNVEWMIDKTRREAQIGTEISCNKCSEGQKFDVAERDLRIATAVKAACLQAAVEAYQHAGMSGLCQEGAFDLALDAIRRLKLEPVLNSLPD